MGRLLAEFMKARLHPGHQTPKNLEAIESSLYLGEARYQ